MSNTRLLASLMIAAALSSCTKKDSAAAGSDTAASVSIFPGGAVAVDRTSSVSAADPDVLACQEAADALAPAELLGANADPDHITTDLVLPELRGDILVTWTTGHAAITATGEVTRPASASSDLTGTVEAAFVRGNARAVRAYAFTVLREESSDVDSVAADKAALVPAAILGMNQAVNRIVVSVSLPSTGAHGTAVTWTSSNPAMSAAGVVTRPAANTSAPSVAGDLVATIAKGAVSDTVTFHTVVLRAQAALLITEVAASTYIDGGWIEVQNTTNAAIDLSQYGWRSCNASTCASIASGTLPAVSLAAGHYILMHPASAYNEVNGAQDIALPSFQLHYSRHFFEITKAGATVDFVRWATSGQTLSTAPLSGSFSGTPVMTSGAAGKSLQRPYPHDDTDSASDWIFMEKATPGGSNGTGAVAGTDTDGDGLTDDYEVNVSHTDPNNPDTDGDGFTDGQEILDSGVAGVSLKALGADPRVRDIFMELDHMAPPAGVTNNLFDSTGNAYSLRLRQAALDKVTAVFAAYTPPAGGFPIHIHFDAGNMFGGAYNLGGGNEIPFERCISLGHDGAHTLANCADLYELKQQNFASARRYIFHYFIVGWSQQTDGSAGSSGLAEIDGNDGIITIGSWGYNASIETAVVNFQAATILHELGHNLGLQHGGGDSMNYKPNYMSSMNYTYQLDGLDADDDGDIFYRQFTGSPSPLQNHPLHATAYDISPNSNAFVMDYSHGTRATLDEQALNETLGWHGVPIDFSFDGAKTSASVQNNVQPATYNTANTDVLHDFDDWSHLDLRFQEHFAAEMNGVGPSTWMTDANTDDDVQSKSTPCLSRPEWP